MIFVTVGAQMPFDRMVRAVDQWAFTRKRTDVIAQIGATDYRPQSLSFSAFMDPPEFRKKVEEADVIVAHAGMGSILTALELGKPILVVPRRGDLRETRNDHQLATARQLLAQGRIAVAFDEAQLLEKLDDLDELRPAECIGAQASNTMLSAIRAFIEGRKPPLSAAISTAEKSLLIPETIQNRIRESPPERVSLTRQKLRSPPVGQTYSDAHIKSRLSSMILLAGRLHNTELGRHAGRSRLDLPIDHERSVLAFWRDEADGLASAWNRRQFAMRVLMDSASPVPTLPPSSSMLSISLERDKSEFRGTGGVLRDACAAYDDDEWVLVANAAQLLFGSLSSLAERMADAGGDINVVHDSNGIPSGLILLRCGVLREVSEIGYHDMKEQVIPMLARRHRVKVVSSEGLTSRPIHSLKDYTEVLRAFHGVRGQTGAGDSGERWQPLFSIQEPGASIAPSAVIHDAVILRGAVIEKGAVVVRSLVGQNARVRSGQRVVDQIVF